MGCARTSRTSVLPDSVCHEVNCHCRTKYNNNFKGRSQYLICGRSKSLRIYIINGILHAQMDIKKIKEYTEGWRKQKKNPQAGSPASLPH